MNINNKVLMNTNDKNCANIVKCVGTLSEIKLDYIYSNDNIICKGYYVIKSNDSYIKFNIYTNKKYIENYYNLIEIMGLQYNFFESIDRDKYTLNETLINVGLSGRINLFNDKQLINKIELKPTYNPTKLFITANLNDYGLQTTYISRTYVKDYIDVRLQGIPYSIDKDLITLVILSKDMYSNVITLQYDKEIYNKILNIPVGSICDLQVEWCNNYNVNNNIISNVNKSNFILKDIIATNVRCEKRIIKQAIVEYNIIKNSKNQLKS